MRYITFTHVDVQTGLPVTMEPARNGPTLPADCVFGFALESQYPTVVPIFYGQTGGALDTPGILSVITKAEYDSAEAAEMAAREAKDTPPAAPRITYKADVWRRADDAQAAIIDTELTKLNVRMRRLWDDASYLDHSTEEFALLQSTMIAAFGESEAARILAPSDV